MVIALLALLITPFPGDQQYADLKYDDAEHAYEQGLVQTPDNPELLWRLARVHISMGEVADPSDKEQHFRAAERYARRCTVIDSIKAEGHTWLAAALGNIAAYEGSSTKVHLANEIRHELDVALALNPNDDVAYSILGSFYRALGNVSWLERQLANVFLGGLPDGGYEESEAALKKAIALAPRVLRHQFELALLYIDWDKPEQARAVLQQCETLPILVASDRPTQVRTRELLAQIE